MSTLELLQIFWFFIIFFALFAFSALDGFDLGVGVLHLVTTKDRDRRIFLNAIGPVWDGNAVWLIIIAGALLAGFPKVFGAFFSGFYDLWMILVVGLIFRAVSIEFRSKGASKIWRNIWDILFSLSSIIISATVGFIFANMIMGVPIDANGVFKGDFKTFFNFYSIEFAICVVAVFAMHGLIYLMMKTEPPLQTKLRRLAMPLVFLVILTVTVLTLNTWYYQSHLTRVFRQKPWLSFVPLLGILSTGLLLLDVYLKNMGRAFIWSTFIIFDLFLLCALGKFPKLLHSTINHQYDLTIYNSSSSLKTLTVLFYVVVIGVPFVLAYSFWLYKSFRGKVILDSHSY